MRIAALETVLVSLPLRRAHKWTGLREAIGRYVIVRLIGETGAVGWGEASVLKDWGGDYGRYYGETPEATRQLIENYLAPALIGADPANFIELHRRMDAAIKGYPYAKAAVESAAYDLVARSLGIPVYQLLGGLGTDRIPITHSIGLLPIEEAVAESAQVVAEGIRTIKIKGGSDPERDIEIVRRIREEVGPEIEICLDANQGYRTPKEAIQTIRKMERYGLKYVEQPVEGIARLAQVAAAVDTPVMADESAWSPADVVEIAERRAADMISIYYTKPGGLMPASEMAAVARAAGLPYNVNGSAETGVGNLASLQLAAAISVPVSCVIPVSTPAEAQRGQIAGIFYSDDLLSSPLVLEDGCLRVPPAAGMGIDIDQDKVAKYAVRAQG